jgi:hypothetical protein
MLPKKTKITHNITPPRVGTEFMKYGIERIEELMQQTDAKTKYLPRTIEFEDIDQGVFDYINSDKMNISINGDKVPLFYLENDRWGEFSKTWKFMDGDKNVPTPYITIRRIDKQPGTRLGTKYRVPQGRKFRYLNIPILDEGELIYLLMKMPQPVNVDLIYEVVLFTKYRVDVNQYDEQVLRNFASRQDYLFINGSPMPVHFEGFAESNTIENIDGDRFIVSKYALKVLGFIQDEKEFEIVKTLRKPRIGYIIS